MCLEHVRAFNAGYDWFEGMSADEIYAAQMPGAGWRTESPAFGNAAAAAAATPRWADFVDPLEAISARANGLKARTASRVATARDGRFTPAEAAALEVLGLAPDVDRRGLRRRYSDLVRRYHPDRNGGDRRHEDRLGRVVEAYNLLRSHRAFG